ncbi:MAG: NAD(P)-binding domain-containing protein [Hyphomicrobiaceae bacterium]
MTKLGIVGVGHLADYTVRGLRNGGWTHQIFLSPRGKDVGARLAQQCNCQVMADNQAVADASDIVMLAPRPPQALAALEGLTLRSDQVLLSVVAGLSIAEMKPVAGKVGAIVRALPVTSAEVNASPNILFPANAAVENLFAHCGTAIPLSSEADFDAGGVLACVYGWYLALYDQLTERTVAAGLDEPTARRIVTGMAGGAAAIAAAQSDQSVDVIARKIASEGSFTKLGLDHLEAEDAFGPWREAYDLVLNRFTNS